MRRKPGNPATVLLAFVFAAPLALGGCGDDGGEAAKKITKEAASQAGKVLREWQRQGGR
jgi:hypothetical protein